jgi:hypothetical protein
MQWADDLSGLLPRVEELGRRGQTAEHEITLLRQQLAEARATAGQPATAAVMD